MRQLAFLGTDRGGPLRVLLHCSPEGTRVFTRASEEDGPCDGEAWFEELEEAVAHCSQVHGVAASDWRIVPDPHPECQEDWVSQVRVKGRNEGAPQCGRFERFENGEWRDVGNPNNRHAG
jgi:hypothetical protein